MKIYSPHKLHFGTFEVRHFHLSPLSLLLLSPSSPSFLRFPPAYFLANLSQFFLVAVILVSNILIILVGEQPKKPFATHKRSPFLLNRPQSGYLLNLSPEAPPFFAFYDPALGKGYEE